MTRTLTGLAIVVALLLGVGLTSVANAQVPYYSSQPYVPSQPYQPVAQPQATAACPSGGAQPITSSYVDEVRLYGGYPVIVPFNTGLNPFGFGTGFYNPGYTVATVVTTTQNYQGVQGLTQTVISDNFSTPYATIGVPDYLFQAYGGNITAIQRDLAAGYLKCRTS
jgi:hypothetical protein